MGIVMKDQIQKNQNPPKFHKEFMAFASDEHTAKILEEAARKTWNDCPVIQSKFDVSFDTIKKIGCPDILLIDLSDEERDVRELAEQIVTLASDKKMVIAIGLENEVSLYRDLLEIGLTDYIVKPVTAHEVHKAINRALDEQAKSVENEEEIHEQILFIGTRGGVGCSTLAANAAWILAEELNYNTSLIDFDIHYGTAALSLDIQPCSGLRDALKRPDRLDDLLLSSSMANVTKKLSVLATEENPNEEIRVDPKAAAFISQFAKNKSSYTIIDCPRTSVQLYESLFLKTDHLMIVSDLSLAGIRDAVRLKKIAKKIAPKMKIYFVINRQMDIHSQVSEKDFERGIDDKISFVIPDDPKPVGKAANAGCAISKIDNNAKSVLAIKNLCQTFSRRNAPSKQNWLSKIMHTADK